MIDDNTVTIAERYVTAGRSSNLRCETGEDAPMGDVAVFIAAGWSPKRIGAVLLRLHTKVDRSGLEQVHEQIMMQAQAWGIERPAAVSSAVLSWWLSNICEKCEGRRDERITNTPALSALPCRPCHGTGKKPIPQGEGGRRLIGFLDDCKNRATDSIKRRLKAMQ